MDQGDEKLPPRTNFILFGKTGSGISASGNTILGRKVFNSKKSPRSVTQDVQIENGDVKGHPVTVYDTPGFFDTEMNNKKIIEKCQSVLNNCQTDTSVFLLVIKADRYTAEERRTVENVEKLLGQDRLEKTWILFTRGDELKNDNLTIKEFLKDTPELNNLVKKYNNRYHVFNNSDREISQVSSLLLKIYRAFKEHSCILQSKKPSRPGNMSERRLVLLGKAGVGKSASGNTILGQNCFKSLYGKKAVTKESEVNAGKVDGRNVSVVDTPGLFDTDMDPSKLFTEIGRCMYLSSPGPHAFLIVLPVTGRFTKQEQQVIQEIKSVFGEEATKYAVLLFTSGDQLEGEIETMIEECSALRELVQQCGYRYHVFNNKKSSNRKQVTELLEKIDRMVEQNGGTCYSNKVFEEAARCREEEENKQNDEKQGDQVKTDTDQKEEMERDRKHEENKTDQRTNEQTTQDQEKNGNGGGFQKFLKFFTDLVNEIFALFLLRWNWFRTDGGTNGGTDGETDGGAVLEGQNSQFIKGLLT